MNLNILLQYIAKLAITFIGFRVRNEFHWFPGDDMTHRRRKTKFKVRSSSIAAAYC
jgi:hypothetical protein